MSKPQQPSYVTLTLEQAEAMSLNQFAALPLSVIERIVRSYAGAGIQLSDTPHDKRYTRGKTCVNGHFFSAHGKRYNGVLVCTACQRSRQLIKQLEKDAARSGDGR